jgi:hypothetical protein
MGRPQAQFMLASLTTVEDLARYTAAALDEIQGMLSGRLVFVDNVQASGPLTASLGTQPTAISHSLNRVPAGYLIISQDAAASIFRPSVVNYPWSQSQIFLQASSAVNATLYVI